MNTHYVCFYLSTRKLSKSMNNTLLGEGKAPPFYPALIHASSALVAALYMVLLEVQLSFFLVGRYEGRSLSQHLLEAYYSRERSCA